MNTSPNQPSAVADTNGKDSSLISTPPFAVAAAMLFAAIAGIVIVTSFRAPYRPHPGLGLERAKLHAAQKLWVDRNLTSYSFTIEGGCFCAWAAVAPVRITVENKLVARAVLLASGERFEAGTVVPLVSARWLRLGTVVDQFDLVQRFLSDQHIAEVVVEYDPELGYPRKMYVDRTADTVDDEMRWTIADFEAAK